MNASVEPKPIKRLAEELINRIAAGEIIQRPCNALKELLENSLDAGSKSIKISVKDGGLRLLQVVDDGCGIRKEDLGILAERFTTSKLSTFDDLKAIRTYGFRGEALASMSHVARLSVVSRSRGAGAGAAAWRATYVDGVLVDPSTGAPGEPRPTAGNDGTVITIEDMFYNTRTRLEALKNTSDEYSRILDVVTRYAVHNPTVSFFVKKAGAPTADVSTAGASTSAQVIRMLYGHSVAKELVSATVESKDGQNDDDEEAWSATVHFTNPNYQAKRTTFLLFVNHRLVESSRMKRALEAIYQGILPKGACPWIYLNLEIDPRSVDVNVHPTKSQVHFLNEEEITQKIADRMQEMLAKESQSRTFEYQTVLTPTLGIKERSNEKEEVVGDETGRSKESQGGKAPKVYSHLKVRTSLKDRTLDSMFPLADASQVPKAGPSSVVTSAESGKTGEIKESRCFLASVKTLRQRIAKGKHRQLAEVLEKHIFVGIVDAGRCLSLVQSSTKLYLLNHEALAEELFYQLGVRQFGDFSRIKLEPPPMIRDLIKLAVDADETTNEIRLSKEEITNKITSILQDRREMLKEYFSMSISEDGHLESLPMLLKGYIPNLDRLPGFLMRLGPQVDWTRELECFDAFLKELALLYVPLPVGGQKEEDKERSASQAWQLQHVLFPAFRRHLVPPKTLLDGDVVQVADLPDLYKIFERC